MSTTTRKILLFLFGGIAVMLLSLLSTGESNATPAEDTSNAITQFVNTVGADPAKAIADAQVSATEIANEVIADPQAAIAEVFVPEPTQAPALISTPIAPEPFTAEQIVTDHLPASLPAMIVDRVDPLATDIASTVYGQEVILPPANITTTKESPLAEQVEEAKNLFISQEITADINSCGKLDDVSKFECSTAMVDSYQSTGNDDPSKVVMIARYGVWLESVDGPCGGYLAAYQMCNEMIFVSAMAADNITGHPSTSGELFGLTSHERGHVWQQQQVFAQTGDPSAFNHIATKDLEAEALAEDNADIAAGMAYYNAVQAGELTRADYDAFLVTIHGAGNNSGNPNDPHATGLERQLLVQQGWELAAAGKQLPAYEYATSK